MAEAGSRSGSDYFAEYAAGDFIFKEGDSGTEMYIIDQGVVEIVRKPGRSEQILAELEHGDFFGEMAILEDLPRGAAARAKEACRVLRIDRPMFNEMLRENPEIAVRMMRKLSRRLREAEAGGKGVPAEATPMATSQLEQQEASAAPKLSFLPPPPKKKAAKPAAGEAPPPAADAPPAPAAPKTDAPKIAKLVEAATGKEFTLASAGESTVGRFDSVTGISPVVDLSAVDTARTTSRRHAKIIRDGDRLFVHEEVGTANGTFVNGTRIQTGQNVEIKNGDEVRFGSVSTKVRF